MGDLCRALAAVPAPWGAGSVPSVASLELGSEPNRSEHTELFTLQLYPYASVYLGPEGQLGGVARDRIAGFLRALNVVPPPEPDHLSVLLDAYAQLLDLDRSGSGARARHARTVLLHEHLLSWLPRYTARVAELFDGHYARWALLLERFLASEADALGPCRHLPAHLRDAPTLESAMVASLDEFIAAALAPVRSGLLLTRADLVRTAEELGLGLRIGERAFTLRGLLSQDATSTLGWLGIEAERQSAAVVDGTPIGTFWRERLAVSGRLLREAAASAPMTELTA